MSASETQQQDEGKSEQQAPDQQVQQNDGQQRSPADEVKATSPQSEENSQQQQQQQQQQQEGTSEETKQEPNCDPVPPSETNVNSDEKKSEAQTEASSSDAEATTSKAQESTEKSAEAAPEVKEGESTKVEEEPKEESSGDGHAASAPSTPRSALKREKKTAGSASGSVRFSQEVSVAAHVFDERNEVALAEEHAKRDQQDRLKEGKEQEFSFSPRRQPRSAEKKTKAAPKKESEESSVEKENAGDSETKPNESDQPKPQEASDTQQGQESAAAAGGADGEEEEQPQQSPSQSKRSLKERLADFKYEADPNERLYWQGLVKIDHQHNTLQEKEDREIVEAERIRGTRHTPSKAAQNLPTPSNFDEFLSNREIRTKSKAKVWEKKKQKTLKDQMEDVTFSPSVGDKSKKLVNKMQQEKRYKDPVRGWRTHFNDFVTKEARVAEKFDNSDQAVTPVRVRTTQERFERLYQESAIRKAAQEIVNQAHDAEFSGATFKPETTYNSSHPGFSSGYDDEYGEEMDTASFSSRSHHAVIESLLEKGENAKKKIEELRRRAEEETYTFTPKTNKVSQKMVQSWSEKAITPREERAARARTSAAAKSIHELSPDVKGVVDNKPKAKFDVDLFYSKIHRAASEREQRLREIDERKREAEIAECTFRPRTTVSGSIQGSDAGSFSNYSTPRNPQGRNGGGQLSGRPQASARSNAAPRTSRANLPAGSSRNQQPARKLPQRQANERDYVVDLVAVPPSSSSPPTSRTLLDEDGTTDLAALQNELMGVIAEWQNIDA